MKQEYIESGKIVGTHGIRGMLRIQPWCDTPDFLCGFQTLYMKHKNGETAPLQILSAHPHGNVVLAVINGVDTLEAAEALRGQTVYINRGDLHLEDDRYLICDLIGCKVLHAETNAMLGTISEVSKTGANDVWHIQQGQQEYLIPAIPDVVQTVDVDDGTVTILPLDGIFDNVTEPLV